jgi:hypothetical protein
MIVGYVESRLVDQCNIDGRREGSVAGAADKVAARNARVATLASRRASTRPAEMRVRARRHGHDRSGRAGPLCHRSALPLRRGPRTVIWRPRQTGTHRPDQHDRGRGRVDRRFRRARARGARPRPPPARASRPRAARKYRDTAPSGRGDSPRARLRASVTLCGHGAGRRGDAGSRARERCRRGRTSHSGALRTSPQSTRRAMIRGRRQNPSQRQPRRRALALVLAPQG